MRSDVINKAYQAYRTGDFEGALRLYHRLASELGHKAFYATILLCLGKLDADASDLKSAGIDCVARSKFDIFSELFGRDVIVSLTSYPARICAVAETVRSLMVQSFKPEKILLWLAKEQFPGGEEDLPPQLLQLKSEKFSIGWCEDIGPYKKLIPTLARYPDNIIVTADDDILYEPSWLAQLMTTHIQEPGAIVCHRAHRVSLADSGNFDSYGAWDKCIQRGTSSFDYIFTGCGGVLYPPGSLASFEFSVGGLAGQGRA
ncbi:hypothetical protein [Caballeronia sp. Lep1P3]|uniref:hypothetical protein n=1 Tax=Caballeronia sp. Lep1P3 TaxID=2878150 RepID=UPI001FD34256|nr:hypothetical protein [Caballeronia sp. Lep1P3]